MNLQITGVQNFMGYEIPVLECNSNRFILAKTISLISSKRLAHINESINSNIHKLIHNVDVIDIKEFIKDNNTISYIGFTKMQVSKANNIYILSEKGLIKLLNIMDSNNSMYLHFLKEYFGSELISIDVNEQRKEHIFLDNLEEQMIVFGIPKGIRQYGYNNYRIDYYIEELNIAIEYDENGHRHYTYDNQELRQDIIEKGLGCKFIRVSDDNSNLYNSAYIIKEIISCS